MTQASMRVLHVLAELRPSGAETMLVAAAPYFRDAGVVADVVATGAAVGPYGEQFAAAGYRIHHIPFKRSPRFFWDLRRLILKESYDVVHLHCENANFWFALTALSAGSPRVVQTIHNAFAFTGTLRQLRGWQRRMSRRLGVRQVSISDSVRDTELRHFKLPTTLVWNWYNSDRFVAASAESRHKARAYFGISDEEFVISSVGNCSTVKNHSAVIEAMAMLEPEFRPVYLHAGIEQADAPERELATRLGVAERIRFLGGIPDVATLLQASDGFVMPSIYEGFGIAAIEALATGLPALFSDVAGLKDFREVFPGLVYSGTSAESVADGLRTLMSLTQEQRARCLRDYPAIALKRFGIKRGVSEYLDVYRQQ